MAGFPPAAEAAWEWEPSCWSAWAPGLCQILSSTVCLPCIVWLERFLIDGLVDGGHRAIKYSRLGGVKKDIYSEGKHPSPPRVASLLTPSVTLGTHIRIPWVETPIIYDVRAKPRNIPSLTGTKDLQMVNITCRVLSRPRVDALPQIYRTLGQDFDERVLPSIVNEVLKSVVAQFNASQLITQRENVARLVRENLARRAARFNITLDDVSLTVCCAIRTI